MRDSRYEAYLRGVLRTLQGKGFEVTEEPELGDYEVDYLARRKRILRGEYTFCFFSFFKKVDERGVKRYSSAALRASNLPVGGQAFRFVFPVLCSTEFDQDAKDYVRSYLSSNILGSSLVHPVLAELKSHQIIQNETKPKLRGRFPIRRAVDFASECLSFEAGVSSGVIS